MIFRLTHFLLRREAGPNSMFGRHEIDLNYQAAIRLPVLEGGYFKLKLPPGRLVTSRIARPPLSKGVFEQRSAQARTPSTENFVFGENNHLIGRRVPFDLELTEIPERGEFVDNFPVGGVTGSRQVSHITEKGRYEERNAQTPGTDRDSSSAQTPGFQFAESPHELSPDAPLPPWNPM